MDAYAETAGAAVTTRDALQLEIDCFRLHKTIASLANLDKWPQPLPTAVKVIGTAEAIAAGLR